VKWAAVRHPAPNLRLWRLGYVEPGTTFRDTSVDITLELLDTVLADYPYRDFAVRLWNGDTWGSRENPRFSLVLKHSGELSPAVRYQRAALSIAVEVKGLPARAQHLLGL
jgi:hypothetical protein